MNKSENIKKIFEYLYSNKHTKEFCQKNKLSDEVVFNSFPQLNTFIASIDACDRCLKNFDGNCKSRLTFLVPSLEYKDGAIKVSYSECAKKKSLDPNNFEVYSYSDNEVELEKTLPRQNLFVFLNKFTIDYFNKQNPKGVYLCGSCGTGKSLLMYKFAQMLVSKGAKVFFAYYPDLVRELQNSIGTPELERLVLKLKQTDIVMIDDIGREANTQYIRDEILGPVLQYRVDNNLPMFMTSNRDFELLEKHLSETNNYIDQIKAKALMERIKYLMKEYKLEDKDFRKNS